MFKNKLNYLILGGLFCTFSAAAKTGTMVWSVRPNVPISQSISAISPNLSAKCATDIRMGEVLLNINSQKRTLSPSRNYAAFAQINGTRAPNGRFSYNYSILWKVPNGPKNGVFTVKCLGDNHLP